ncbi:MAG: type II secretion system protein F [Corynebacteriales bacterium]|nr:type II secretion system protein F [Mycobacteriales bacterium]
MAVVIGLLCGAALLLIILSGQKTESAGPGFIGRWRGRRQDMLQQAGMPNLGSTRLLFLQVGAGLLLGLLIVIATHSLSVAICFTAFGFVAPTSMVRMFRDRRVRELRDIWPEVVDNLASAVRAGLALPEAVAALAQRGPESLRPAFARFAAEHRVTGHFSSCLDNLKHELSDPVGDRVCESLRIAREVGGTELGRLLRTLSTFLREDARVRAELETRQGWTVIAARLAVASPWAVLLFLSTDATTLQAFDSATGQLLLAVGAALSIGAYRLMIRIGRLPQEPRVLR